MQTRGYLSAEYGECFAGCGEIVTLPRSGIRLIKRHVVGRLFDCIGLYPFSCCLDWDQLSRDVEDLQHSGAVSLALVADPFDEDPAGRAMASWDICRPFKTHWVVDLAQDWRAQRSKSNRYYTRKALDLQETCVVEDPVALAPQFWALYQRLVARHQITGLQAMSASTIEKQLALKDAVLIIARADGGIAGAAIWIDQGLVAHSHLMALSSQAYKIQTSYALTYAALEHFQNRDCRYANVGGASGLVDDPADGLFRFKKRWANTHRRALFGGLVLDRSAYSELANRTDCLGAEFFPTYRGPGTPFSWRPDLAVSNAKGTGSEP